MRLAPLAFALASLLASGCEGATPHDPVTGGADAGGPQSSLRLVTLNAANGAGDRFRTSDSRARQGAFLARTGADVIALQEIDIGADRSGNVDTASLVAAAMGPDFVSCSFEVAPAPHLGRDGTRLGRCPGGAVVFGVGFRADDSFDASTDGTPSGIIDDDASLDPTGVDRGADAYFGNALVVRAPWEVDAAYTVALPVDGSDPAASAPSSELLSKLGGTTRDADALATLAAHNLETRMRRGIEPRSALVVRIRHQGSPSLTVLATHLESAGPPALRAAQLATVVAIARAERSGATRRPVVVLGDFNMPPAQSAPPLLAAGFAAAVAPGVPAPDIDQIWVDLALTLEESARLSTEGVSDHTFTVSAKVRSAGYELGRASK